MDKDTQNPKGKKLDKEAAKQAPDDEKQGFKDAGLLEPTRFGDWEVNGRCSDF